MKRLILICLLFLLSNFAIAENQLIVVTIPTLSSFYGSLQRFQHTNHSQNWQPVGNPWPVVIGKNGATKNKKEGDLKTPLGHFRILKAFGINPNGSQLTKMTYLQITAHTLCVDDPSSRFYNQIIDTSKIAEPDWHSGEQMVTFKNAYQLGLIINNNQHPIIPGNGSCVFLHVWDGKNQPTAGCIAMSLSRVKKLLGWLNPSDDPILSIVPSVGSHAF